MSKYGLAFTAIFFLCNTVNAQTIAILDHGHNTLNSNNTPAEADYVQQLCFSASTNIDAVLNTGSISLCQNSPSGTDTSTENAAQVPFNIDIAGTNVRLGAELNHGNIVSAAARDFAGNRTLKYVPIQIFSAIRERLGNNRLSVRYFGNPPNVLRALEWLNQNAQQNNIDVVNLSIASKPSIVGASGGTLCRNQAGRESIEGLIDQDILSVTGFLNSGIRSNEQTWPQCIIDAIKVGSSTATGGILDSDDSIGIGANQITYFADGRQNLNGMNEGNSFAAPRVAAYFALMKNKYKLSTIQDRVNAIQAFGNFHTYNGYTRRNVKSTDVPGGFGFLDLLFPPDITNEQLISSSNLDFTDDESYGVRYSEPRLDEYSFDIRLEALPPVASGSIAVRPPIVARAGTTAISNRRDIIVGFTGSFSNTGTYGFKIFVNDQLAHETSDFFSFRQERNYSITIHRKYFSDDKNEVTIKPTFSSLRWGIRNISAQFAPIIPLTIDQIDAGIYGYSQNPKRLTGARASFSLLATNQDLFLDVVGWDIDTDDETSIFLNGTHIGFLTTGGSSAYTRKNTLVLPQSLLRTNLNYIELVQRETDGSWEGFEDEKWAVKNLHVRSKPDSNIVSILTFLLDE